MTSGGISGTSGIRLKPLLWIGAVTIVVGFVNATSVLMEARRDGDVLSAWKPFLWEYSSAALLLALAPLVGLAIQRLPPRREGLARFVLLHAALTVPFSLVHVTGMAAIRMGGYALAGQTYDFAHGMLPLELLYEWRKDVLSYAVVAFAYWFFGRRPATSAAVERIEVRDGGTAVFLAPVEIVSVEAAGNYVEFRTAGRTHLVRGTLAAWETTLAPHGFLRVHRSRLINRAHIRALKPTPAGDFEITLEDGRSVLGSRRYRAALESRKAA